MIIHHTLSFWAAGGGEESRPFASLRVTNPFAYAQLFLTLGKAYDLKP
jgi:hypothetical protein